MALLKKLWERRRERRNGNFLAKIEADEVLTEQATRDHEVSSSTTKVWAKPFFARMFTAPLRAQPPSVATLHTLREEAEALALKLRREQGVRTIAAIEEVSAVAHRHARGQELRGFRPEIVSFVSGRVARSAESIGANPSVFCRDFGDVLLQNIRA